MTCDTCKHWKGGCTLSEALIDGRGEPTVGNPQACGYFEGVPVFKNHGPTSTHGQPGSKERGNCEPRRY